MNNKSFLYIILGLLVGAQIGVFFTPVTVNDMIAILGGALAGVFIGWFAFAAMNIRSRMENDSVERKADDGRIKTDGSPDSPRDALSQP